MERDLRAIRQRDGFALCSIAAAVIGSALGSAGASAVAGKSAAKTQANAAMEAGQLQLQASREAAALQLGMFNTVRSDLAPYRNFGASALPGYAALLGLPSPGAGGYGGGQAPTSTGSSNGIIDLVRQPDGSYGTGAVAPVAPMRAGDTNWAQMLKDRPDVLAEYNKILPTVDWNSPWAGQHGFVQGGGPEKFAEWWYGSHKANGGDYNAPTWAQEDIDKLYPQAGGQQPTSMAPTSSGPALDAGGIQKYLESLPGYQFTRDQGMQAVSNQMTAKGLGGVSGAYGKGLARFVTGLADQTYGSQLDRIAKAVGVGQSSAAQTGQYGTEAASGAANSIVGGGKAAGEGIIGAGNAKAAGTIAVGNAVGSAAQGAAGGLLTSRVLSMYAPNTPRLI